MPDLMESFTASNDLPAAEALAVDRSNVEAVKLDASDSAAVQALIEHADVVLRCVMDGRRVDNVLC